MSSLACCVHASHPPFLLSWRSAPTYWHTAAHALPSCSASDCAAINFTVSVAHSCSGCCGSSCIPCQEAACSSETGFHMPYTASKLCHAVAQDMVLAFLALALRNCTHNQQAATTQGHHPFQSTALDVSAGRRGHARDPFQPG